MDKPDEPEKTYSVRECIDAIRNIDPKTGLTDDQIKQIVLNTWVNGEEDIKKIKSELAVWRKEFIESQRRFLEANRVLIFIPKKEIKEAPMPERVLVFGNLKDIIFVKEAQEKVLRDKIDKFREPFPFYDPEECKYFCENNNAGCCGCDFENMCEKDRRKYSAHIKTLEDERNEINTELIVLWHEVHFREQALFNKRIIK